MSLQQYPLNPGFKNKSDGPSQQAAIEIAGDAKSMRAHCLALLQSAQLTADEVASTLGRSVLSIRPRISELYVQGKIEDSGARRLNGSGKRATVWAAKR